MVTTAPVEPARRHHPGVLRVEVSLLRPRRRGLVPGVAAVDGVAERVGVHERFTHLPVVVERAAQQDAQAEVDLHEVGRQQLTVDHDAGRHKHGPAPVGHPLVRIVALFRIVERAPAAQQYAPAADRLIAGQGLVEEVEQVVVQRDGSFHELDVLEQTHLIVSEELDRRYGPPPPG